MKILKKHRKEFGNLKEFNETDMEVHHMEE